MHYRPQPAVKILPFLRGVSEAARSVGRNAVEAGGIPSYETRKLQQYSPSMKNLEPLGDAHASAWVAYWKQSGFLVL